MPLAAEGALCTEAGLGSAGLGHRDGPSVAECHGPPAALRARVIKSAVTVSETQAAGQCTAVLTR